MSPSKNLVGSSTFLKRHKRSHWFHEATLVYAHLEWFIKYSRGMLYAVVLYVRPSVCFHDNLWMNRRRMMKHGAYVLEVKSNMELEDG